MRVRLLFTVPILACAFLPAQTGHAQLDDPVRVTVMAHYVSWHIQGSPGWDGASILPFRRGDGHGEGYTSLDPEIIAQHNEEFLKYGITPVSSWWGIGDRAGDEFLDAYLSVPSPVRTAVLYEATGLLPEDEPWSFDFDDEATAEAFARDIVHLSERYFSKHPERFVHIDGRPVVFIWVSSLFKGDFASVVERLRERVDVFIVGSDFNIHGPPGDERLEVIRGLDAVSAYGLYSPHDAEEYGGRFNATFVAHQAAAIIEWAEWLRKKAPGTMLIPPLMFAYNDTGVIGRPLNPPMVSSEGEAALQAGMVHAIIGEAYHGCSNILPYVMFVSYNEHYEGTSLEATMRNGSEGIRRPYEDDFGWSYLNIIRSSFGFAIAERARTCSPF